MIISLVLITVVLLSASSAFAADDNNATLGETDEIVVEETINSVEVTDQVASVEDTPEAIAADEVSEEIISNSTVAQDNVASDVVTKETFHNYFNNEGFLLDNVTSDELIFSGDFSGIDVNRITIDKSIKFTGKGAVFNNVRFDILADDITVDGFTLTQSSSDLCSFYMKLTTNVTLSNNKINFTPMENSDGIAIYANTVSVLNIIDNTITYVGNTVGNSFNNAIRIEGDDGAERISHSILVKGNTFDINVPSVDVNYNYWPDTITYSEGIVFYYCADVGFSENVINLRYNNFNTKYGYDSIYVVSVRGNPNKEGPIACYSVVIDNNTINAVGHSYIYGISVAAHEAEVINNVLNISSDGAYANGITVDGPSNGEVSNNKITLAANEVTYGIYSAQYEGAAISDMIYSYNTVDVDSYFACGMELMEKNPIINYNVITATGNHTSGIIASISREALIKENKIYSLGNNAGTDSTGDLLLPLNSLGISIKGKHLIQENTIESSSIGINLVENGPSTIVNNNISVMAVGLLENYGIYAFNYSDMSIVNNNIRFVGSVDGMVVNNAIRVIGDEKKENIASNITVNENTFDITIPSVDVDYDHWPDTVTYSEAVLFYYCRDVEFCNNVMDVDYNGVFTEYGYDCIYVVSLRGNPYNDEVMDPIACYNVKINGNTIDAVGHAYIYGISIAAYGFEVSDNELDLDSDGYYANGITVNGPSNGQVINNEIILDANNVTYGIYSAQYGDAVIMDMIYSKNDIYLNSYAACGMEVMESNPVIKSNEITASGNYTYGIVASIKGDAQISNNSINSLGNNIGNIPTGDELLPLNSIGISTKGMIALNQNDVSSSGIGVKTFETTLIASKNRIVCSGDYALVLDGKSNATILNNYLSGKKAVGNNAVTGGNNVTVDGNTPLLKVSAISEDINMVYGEDVYYVVRLIDENGDPVRGVLVYLTLEEGSELAYYTDENGRVALSLDSSSEGNYTFIASFRGNDIYRPCSVETHVNIGIRNAILRANDIQMVYGDNNEYGVWLMDRDGSPVDTRNVTVKIGVNEYILTTSYKGYATLNLDSVDAGSYNVVASFKMGAFVAEPFKSTLVVTPKATNFVSASTANVLLTAIKKGYYYEITLKDTSGKVLANKKVTITFNGKTYTKTTNSKGLIKFKLASTTVGNKKLTMKFAGDNNYKATSKSATIKITKEATKLVASSASFKVNTKTKVVKVTLKDSKNKGVGGVQITLRVNGVNYVAKTVSSGVANVKITKLNKVGSFGASIKFAGNNYYKAASKAIKITVKK